MTSPTIGENKITPEVWFTMGETRKYVYTVHHLLQHGALNWLLKRGLVESSRTSLKSWRLQDVTTDLFTPNENDNGTSII